MLKLTTFFTLLILALPTFAGPSLNPAPVPEPALLPLLGLGLIAMALSKRLKK